MSDFGRELARLMQARGVGVRELARAAYCNPGHISNLRSGKARPSPQLAETLDRHLGAGGTLAAIAARSASGRQRGRATRSSGPSRAVEALQIAMNGNGDGLDIAEDGMAELVRHYAITVAVAPSVAVYDELVSARSFAGKLLDRGGRARRPELAVTTGWLSSLLAISATDLGDHAAALVWCADTEHRGRDAGYPELLGWAALTRSLIAWYQGDPARSAAAARRGQAEAPAGTVARAKLACAGNALPGHGRRHGRDVGRAPAGSHGDEPARSVRARVRHLLGAARRRPAVHGYLTAAGGQARRGGSDDAADHRDRLQPADPRARRPADQLRAHAADPRARGSRARRDRRGSIGRGGTLESGPVVWPTMVLAGKLDQSLAARCARQDRRSRRR